MTLHSLWSRLTFTVLRHGKNSCACPPRQHLIALRTDDPLRASDHAALLRTTHNRSTTAVGDHPTPQRTSQTSKQLP